MCTGLASIRLVLWRVSMMWKVSYGKDGSKSEVFGTHGAVYVISVCQEHCLNAKCYCTWRPRQISVRKA